MRNPMQMFYLDMHVCKSARIQFCPAAGAYEKKSGIRLIFNEDQNWTEYGSTSFIIHSISST